MEWYTVLGVPPTATDDEIKHAYRTRAKELHPDRNPGDEAAATRRFQALTAAFEAAKKRRTAPPRRAPFVHRRRGPLYVRPVADLVVDVDVSIGHFFAKTPMHVPYRRRAGSDFLDDIIAVYPDPGLAERTFDARGNELPGRPRGKLRLRFRLVKSESYKLSGADVIAHVTVPLGSVLLGEPYAVPHPDGSEIMVVPTLSPGDRLAPLTDRFPGRGLPRPDGSSGAFVVHAIPTMPRIDPGDMPLLRHALSRGDDSPRPAKRRKNLNA